ncbi:hypothetical protein [Balneicella halophila]|nr:hypothetical protein [Balneicella halophila]
MMGVLLAQDLELDTMSTSELDEVVVVASRKPTKITEIPGTV